MKLSSCTTDAAVPRVVLIFAKKIMARVKNGFIFTVIKTF